MFQYLRYFIYLAWNWNLAIAWHIIKNEIRGEKIYGIRTTGADELGHLTRQGISIEHATIYMPASYDLLEKLFDSYPPARSRHFVDIGSGKGRVMAVAAAFGATNVTGIDISSRLSEIAAHNLEKTKQRFPALEYSLMVNDAANYEFEENVDMILFFNPFDRSIMRTVVGNIIHSLKQDPRDITIFYLNPLEKDLFLDEGFAEEYHTIYKGYLEASVFTKKARNNRVTGS